MSTLTIRRLDEKVKERLRVQAALHGRSMEEEARLILEQGVQHPGGGASWLEQIRERVEARGGFEVPVLERTEMAEPWKFE